MVKAATLSLHILNVYLNILELAPRKIYNDIIVLEENFDIMKLKYLFWNVDVENNKSRKQINPIIKKLLDFYCPDIAMFAEYKIDDKDNLIRIMNESNNTYYFIPQRGCKMIKVFSKLTPDNFEQLTDAARYTLYRIPHPTLGYHILAIAHLPSKLSYSDRTQEEIARRLKEAIEHDEAACDNFNTIIVGDLNMNPFEDGLTHAASIHSFSSRDFIQQQKGSRIVQDVNYTMFYNPMWCCFGDENLPAGSYFYGDSDIISYGWNMFDQVLLRPSLCRLFQPSSIKIIDKIEDFPLLDNLKRPNRRISDHLPLYFEL